MVMTVYLWHFVPVIVIAVAFYPTGVMPQPADRDRRSGGSCAWPGWPCSPWCSCRWLAAVMRAERPMLRLPAGIGRPGPWSPALLRRAWSPPWSAWPGSPSPDSRRADTCRHSSWPPAPSAWPRPCSPAAPRPHTPRHRPPAHSSRASRISRASHISCRKQPEPATAAQENPLWEHRQIHGELTKLGVTVAPSTVWAILHAAGINPAPRRSGPGLAAVPACPGCRDRRSRFPARGRLAPGTDAVCVIALMCGCRLTASQGPRSGSNCK